MFGNPLAEEANYRAHVVHAIPSLHVFDRQVIELEERRLAKRYAVEWVMILVMIMI